MEESKIKKTMTEAVGSLRRLLSEFDEVEREVKVLEMKRDRHQSDAQKAEAEHSRISALTRSNEADFEAYRKDQLSQFTKQSDSLKQKNSQADIDSKTIEVKLALLSDKEKTLQDKIAETDKLKAVLQDKIEKIKFSLTSVV